MHKAQARPLAVALALGAVLLCSHPASAVEAWEGRIQAHGFFETQLRAINRDWSGDLDLTQWWNILNVELEFDLLDETYGPVDSVGAYVRAEVRFDCVWTRACGLFPSANTFGDRARKLPRRLSNGESLSTTGAINRMIVTPSSPDHKPIPLPETPGFSALAGNPINVSYLLERFLDFKFTSKKARGGQNFGFSNLTMGPWLPKNFFHGNASVADRINPFDNSTLSPPAAIAGAPTGLGALPYRPIPIGSEGSVNAKAGPARGLYIPSASLSRAVAEGSFSDAERFFNFRQAERQWNHGQSQQQTKELKEAYVEVEMFDGQLWMRLGRQNIVWGKTELFRTTDQFNPTDIAIASLPSLEESRIPLWAGRFILTLWNHPLPVEDLRFELAFNVDQYQPTDLGACGEPYTPDPVCGLTAGIFAHGLSGLGVAGIDTPPAPWEDLRGLEIGGRVEWRWDRFSFALMDFWGYSDGPHAKRISTYERNVDPTTGLPRALGTRGPCQAVLVGTSYQRVGNDCLQPGPTFRASNGGAPPSIPPAAPPNPNSAIDFPESQASVANNALGFHSANQQLFAVICSVTVGFTSLDPAACALNVWGSPSVQVVAPVGTIISGILAGSSQINGLFTAVLNAQGVPTIGLPVVQLNRDDSGPGTGTAREVVAGAPNGSPEGGSFYLGGLGAAYSGLSGHLTPEQEAILGCGPWFSSNCDDEGIDLLNADASAILQSFVGFDGTGPDPSYQIPYAGPLGVPPVPVGAPQPGHVGFAGGPVCTIGLLAGPGMRGSDVLPGCRAVGSPGYAVNVDGGVAAIGFVPSVQTPALNPLIPFQGMGAQNPLHGQTFQSELAAVSWNFLMLLVATSPEFNGATGATAFSTAPGQCSYRQPQFCTNVFAILAVAGNQRRTVEAGGNGQFGRRTFWWHSGGEVLLAYEKRNVLGFSMDVAEDVTKTNWSLEFTWIEGLPFTDNNAFDGITRSDTLNLTVSVDRPTFVNFLNANRTFLINSQWFFQYVPGHDRGFTSNGPFNVLFTFAIATGYFQDRLSPSVVFVYDINSGSGASIAQVGYRFTERFSFSLGMAFFMGHTQLKTMPVNGVGTTINQTGENAYRVGVDNGLAAIRDRDEIFARLRYTF